MNRRLLITLFAVMFIYNLPSWLTASPIHYWLDSIFCSTALIAFLSATQLRLSRKMNIINAVVISIILIELFAIYATIEAWYSYLSSNSQWFYEHYEYIMSACYYVEIVIIIAGLTSGTYSRIYSLCVTFVNRFKAISNLLLSRDRHICKSTQAI